MIRAVFAGTLTLVSSIALTVVSAWLITRAWQMPPVLELSVAVTAVRALGISRAVFRYVDRLASHDVALGAAATARTRIYNALSTAPSGEVMALSRAQLLAHIGPDVDALTDRIVRSTIPRWVAGLTCALAIGFTALLSLPAAGVLAVGLAVAGLIAPRMAAAAERRLSSLDAQQRYVGAVDHVLRNAATLRVRGQLADSLDAAARADRDLAASRAPARPWSARAAGMWMLASALTAVATFAVASLAAPQHSPEWLTVAALLPLAAFEAVASLPDAARVRIRSSRAEDRLGRTIAQGSADVVPTADGEQGMRGGVDAQDLVVGWETPAMTVNLHVPEGGRHVIVAESGAGKTTLLLTLAGLLPPLSGTYRADGARFIAEDEHIFATTVRDNLAVGAADATTEQMWEVLAAVGLADWVRNLDRGLDTVLSDGAAALSGGQRRRIIVARALLTDAPTLLLDEPTEHLDADGEAAMLALLGVGDGARDGASDGEGDGASGGGEVPPLPGARARRTVIVVRHPRNR
ncbi:thiol reductant ABC exporter subunit CydC [Corynebacterium falsenii]|uniref:thiol reductant ABC exporter subunit CydC n=1 Tax=Corynebacterium falsenii TaxID=108486 RepID=UPI001D8D004C|nr:thiol reductant ABC exporter subunit CydC [Corynebacterium falsenii]HJF12141.1 thiol reductant ABC exporter subunit CydC [Corynebacterium falsenii]